MFIITFFIIFAFCSNNLIASSDVKENSNTVQWLYRMEDRLEKIDGIEDKIENYQAILDRHQVQIEKHLFGKDYILRPMSIGCGIISIVLGGGLTLLNFSRTLYDAEHELRVQALGIGFGGLLLYFAWQKDRARYLGCLESDKRIIAKLEALREKFDTERSFYATMKAKVDLDADKYVYNFI